ncbi:ClpP/crotonase-like domain-containing protein [Entophlyctis helioformis]|nr:ClpP/crotonase-like domain-containing protein [Entophlyctis helioformis]
MLPVCVCLCVCVCVCPLYILAFRNGENFFDVPFMDALEAALDYIEQHHPPGTAGALVTYAESSKVYCNGLRLDIFQKVGAKYFDQSQRVLRRFLTFQLPTVAAITGHAFAGGCMLAMAHDYRVMRSDRGFMCMNEVDLPAAMTPGMLALVQAKVPNPLLFRDMILQAHKFNADEALRVGLVDEISPSPAATVEAAKALATRWSSKAIKAGVVYGYLKQQMYVDAARALEHGGMGFSTKVKLTAPPKPKL